MAREYAIVALICSVKRNDAMGFAIEMVSTIKMIALYKTTSAKRSSREYAIVAFSSMTVALNK